LLSDLAGGERLTTPMIRQEGGLVPTTWEKALQAVYSGLKASQPVAGILSGRNTNEEAFLFAKLVKKLAPTMRSKCFTRNANSPSAKDSHEPGSARPTFVARARDGRGTNGGFDALIAKEN